MIIVSVYYASMLGYKTGNTDWTSGQSEGVARFSSRRSGNAIWLSATKLRTQSQFFVCWNRHSFAMSLHHGAVDQYGGTTPSLRVRSGYAARARALLALSRHHSPTRRRRAPEETAGRQGIFAGDDQSERHVLFLRAHAVSAIAGFL